MKNHGIIIKMEVQPEQPVKYGLPIGGEILPLNDIIGKFITLQFSGNIYCIACGRKTGKSFAQGFCYPCFRNAPETSECILRPELCQAHKGIARDMDWAKMHCLQEHFVYLAITSGLKVGVTRSTQIPIRWIDQGAWQTIKFAKTQNRHIAGLIEIDLKKHVSDRTSWQRMLKNQTPKDINLESEKLRMFELLNQKFRKYFCGDDLITEFNYPVIDYPRKVKSVGFDRYPEISGLLNGIKGQYLIFDDGRVLNIRKHQGYEIIIDY